MRRHLWIVWKKAVIHVINHSFNTFYDYFLTFFARNISCSPLPIEPTSSKSAVAKTEDNIDDLVVPVLCNLTACCLELQQWGKATLFIDQIFPLRPLCRKAHYRRGVALLQLHEYSLAIKALETSLETLPTAEISSSKDKESMPLTEAERAKVKHYLGRAFEARRRELSALDKRKAALQKAFSSSVAPTMMSVKREINPDNGEEVLVLHTTPEPGASTDASTSSTSPSSVPGTPPKDAGMNVGMMLLVMCRYFAEQLLFLVGWMLGLSPWLAAHRHWFISPPYPSSDDTVGEAKDSIQIRTLSSNELQEVD